MATENRFFHPVSSWINKCIFFVQDWTGNLLVIIYLNTVALLSSILIIFRIFLRGKERRRTVVILDEQRPSSRLPRGHLPLRCELSGAAAVWADRPGRTDRWGGLAGWAAGRAGWPILFDCTCALSIFGLHSSLRKRLVIWEKSKIYWSVLKNNLSKWLSYKYFLLLIF